MDTCQNAYGGALWYNDRLEAGAGKEDIDDDFADPQDCCKTLTAAGLTRIRRL